MMTSNPRSHVDKTLPIPRSMDDVRLLAFLTGTAEAVVAKQVGRESRQQAHVEHAPPIEALTDPLVYLWWSWGQFQMVDAREERAYTWAVRRCPHRKWRRWAREKMVLANLRLVMHYAKRSRRSDLTPEDLAMCGVEGLMKALDKFKPELGYKLSTYASWWIRQSISRTTADQGRLIRLPVHVHEKVQVLNREERKLLREWGRVPTTPRLAKELGASLDDTAKWRQLAQATESLDVHLSRMSSEDAPDWAHDASTSFAERLEAEHTRGHLWKIVEETLDEREADIIRARFGYPDGEYATLEDIGSRFGVTRERIRQVEAKALKKLRRPLSTQTVALSAKRVRRRPAQWHRVESANMQNAGTLDRSRFAGWPIEKEDFQYPPLTADGAKFIRSHCRDLEWITAEMFIARSGIGGTGLSEGEVARLFRVSAYRVRVACKLVWHSLPKSYVREVEYNYLRTFLPSRDQPTP